MKTNNKLRVEEGPPTGLVSLVLDNGKGNILDAELIGQLTDALEGLRGRQGLRLVAVRGEGRHFCFGAAVDEHLRGSVEAMLPAFHRLFRALEAVGVPTASVVTGQCLGGGLELAVACGWVFASPDARLGVPEVHLGVFPPVAAVLLPWRVGGRLATDLIVTGRSVGGDEAVRLGLVDVCSEDPRAAMMEWYARNLEPRSAVAVGAAWRASRRPVRRALDEELPVVESDYLDDLMSSRDPTEGLTAFVEGRPPVWRHE